MPIRRCSAIIFLGCFLLSSSAKAQWNPLNPVVEIQQQPDGALLTMKTGVVKLQVCTDVIVRVLYSPAPTMPKLQEYVVTKIGWPQTNWAMQSGNDQITLTTPRIKVTVTRKDGNILFADATGKKLFEDYGRTLTPVEVNGEKTYRAEMFSSLWGSYEAFAGAQRNAVAVWSGDVNSDWVFFKKQIPAGLNYSLFGLPYWTTDIGGFVSGDPGDPAYRELFIRWFQFGTFNPILRVHGTRSNDQNELWSYGPVAQKILTSFDRLRYRMLPYIYSLAWETTSQGYTPMRALVMDFRDDARAANISDQFMFGPALLVNPVTEPDAVGRRVYLPAAKWHDFWSGASVEGGRSVDAAAPLDRIPLYVRAGSILPLGPDIEWSTEKSADPIELRVYRGADGDFILYEDENDNYNYEKGVHATIPFHWDDAKQTLTIGERKGQFPGMLQTRSFRIVFAGKNHGIGISPEERPDKVVRYAGQSMIITP